jgi:hydrogenase expression/formation protein HypC
MCLTVAGEVLSVDAAAGTAVVDTGGRRMAISLAPIVLDGGRVAAGDWVLIHTGLAVAVLDEHEAREILDAAAALGPQGDAQP